MAKQANACCDRFVVRGIYAVHAGVVQQGETACPCHGSAIEVADRGAA
jgi:hypothetical protein